MKRVVFMSLEGCVNFEIAEILFLLTKGYIVVLKNFSSVFVCFAFPFSQHFACISFHSFSKSVGVFFIQLTLSLYKYPCYNIRQESVFCILHSQCIFYVILAFVLTVSIALLVQQQEQK